MRVSLKWLREYTPFTQTPQEVAYKLTMAGVEVVTIYQVGEHWQHVYVGEIVQLERHPNADRLQLATVNYGPDRTLTVVTGATNIKVGDKVPLALVGARLIDTHAPVPELRELKPTKLRGIVSEGMVCSAKELSLGEDHEGILVLDQSARVGVPLSEELGDVILDIDVKANRTDCLSVLGVARDVSALTRSPFSLPRIEFSANGPSVGTLADVQIADPDLCPRYMAAVIEGVTIRQSPRWLRDRLTAVGIRPINNVVDVTNYVMMEWGQPLHAFDYDKIGGHRIIVRRAGDGEPITTLDGVQRQLDHDNLVIADKDHPIAVAGVMGGLDSEITSTTHRLLIESATFNPVSVRKTARALKLPSEASRRFERGLPTQLPKPALERAVQLIQEVTGGTIAKGFADAYPSPVPPVEIVLTPAEVKRLLGINISVDQMESLLTPLGFTSRHDNGALLVTVPMHRTDVTLPPDLVEEIARMIGYDNLPETLPSDPQPEPSVNKEWAWSAVFRETMVGLGFAEVLTYSLTSREKLGRLMAPLGETAGATSFMAPTNVAAEHKPHDLAQQITERFVPIDAEPIRLINPLSSDWECMRTSTFGSLLDALRVNLRGNVSDVHLFEIGRIYVPRVHELPDERRLLTAVAGAYQSGTSWGQLIENDFFWMKAMVEALLTRAGIEERTYRPVRHPIFHPTRAAAILIPSPSGPNPSEPNRLDEEHVLIGVIGEVEESVRQAFDIDQRAYLVCLDLDRIVPRATRMRTYEPLPKYPPIVQDIAIVLSTDVQSARVEDLIREIGMPLVKSVELFDVYEGAPIPAGKISLAYHITYQAPDRTLKDLEVADVQKKVERALRGELGAEMRV